MAKGKTVYTPLRYPGGKAKLAEFMKGIIKDNYLMDGHYVEPYAGGAGIALELLLQGYVNDIYINDINAGIFAFWNAVKNHPEELCRRISTCKLSILAWKRHRTVYRTTTDPFSIDLGFSTLFLNRTNRSGILTGGVIGGINQTGAWKIDARFNRAELISRIERLSYYQDRLHIFKLDALEFLNYIESNLPRNCLIYLDPPYYTKGGDLYQNYYKPKDHAAVAEAVMRLGKKWIVSYDNVPEVVQLYEGRRSRTYSLNYSASKPGKGSEVMFFSDLLSLSK